MEAGCRLFGQSPELGVEDDIEAVAGLSVKEGARGNGDSQHLFQTESLGAELDLIGAMTFGFAALVLYGEGLPGAGYARQGCSGRAVRHAMKFDDIRPAGKPEAQVAKRQPASDAQVAAGLPNAAVRLLMKMPAFHGQRVFHPDLFQVDESALPFAEQQVLERGDREEVVFGVHGVYRSSRRLTPAGSRSRCTVTS